MVLVVYFADVSSARTAIFFTFCISKFAVSVLIHTVFGNRGCLRLSAENECCSGKENVSKIKTTVHFEELIRLFTRRAKENRFKILYLYFKQFINIQYSNFC